MSNRITFLQVNILNNSLENEISLQQKILKNFSTFFVSVHDHRAKKLVFLIFSMLLQFLRKLSTTSSVRLLIYYFNSWRKYPNEYCALIETCKKIQGFPLSFLLQWFDWELSSITWTFSTCSLCLTNSSEKRLQSRGGAKLLPFLWKKFWKEEFTHKLWQNYLFPRQLNPPIRWIEN